MGFIVYRDITFPSLQEDKPDEIEVEVTPGHEKQSSSSSSSSEDESKSPAKVIATPNDKLKLESTVEKTEIEDHSFSSPHKETSSDETSSKDKDGGAE